MEENLDHLIAQLMRMTPSQTSMTRPMIHESIEPFKPMWEINMKYLSIFYVIKRGRNENRKENE